MSVVLHSSITLEWIYADKATAALAQAMEMVVAGGAWVPAHWRFEVASVLEHNVSKGRHDFPFRDETLKDLNLLAIRVDPETHGRAWETTLQIAVRRSISFYDAAYLELAQRRGLPLAVVDTTMRRMARHEDVAVVG